ncbi:MAG: TauD/TfdA family dioxygenase [Frankiaceae bacterium]
MREADGTDCIVLALTEGEKDQVWELVQRGEHLDPVGDADGYVLESQELAAGLPSRLRQTLLRFRVNKQRAGGLLIRNLPIGEIPQTPTHADYGIGSTLLASKTMSLAVSVLGDMFGFRPELGGRIIQDILPVQGFEDTQQSISSRAPLEMHCETAFTYTRADYIGLLCVRQDREKVAGTLLSPAHKVLAALDPATVELLRQPRFSTTVDGSFLRGSGLTEAVVVKPIRVVTGTPDYPYLRADFAETAGLDPEAQKAVEDLYRAACDIAASIYLEPGDLLLVDNHQTFHGRTPFRMHGDGWDRWLLRSFVTRDLPKSVADRPGNGRIVDIDYVTLVTGDVPVQRGPASDGRASSHTIFESSSSA